MGWRGGMFGTMGDKYVFHFSMSNQLSDRYPGRGVLHTPHIDLTSTPSPFAGRLVGRMQYAPTFPEKDKVSLGRYFLSSRTIRDKYVFHFFMSNRLSDRYPCRGVKAYATCAFIVYPFALCRAFGRAYAFAPLHCWKKMRFPRAGVFHRLGQSETNTYFIPPCLIGYQIDTRVGRKRIRPI